MALPGNSETDGRWADDLWRVRLSIDLRRSGIELTMTESKTHCDVVLPAATNLDCADLYQSYGHHLAAASGRR